MTEWCMLFLLFLLFSLHPLQRLARRGQQQLYAGDKRVQRWVLGSDWLAQLLRWCEDYKLRLSKGHSIHGCHLVTLLLNVIGWLAKDGDFNQKCCYFRVKLRNIDGVYYKCITVKFLLKTRQKPTQPLVFTTRIQQQSVGSLDAWISVVRWEGEVKDRLQVNSEGLCVCLCASQLTIREGEGRENEPWRKIMRPGASYIKKKMESHLALKSAGHLLLKASVWEMLCHKHWWSEWKRSQVFMEGIVSHHL